MSETMASAKMKDLNENLQNQRAAYRHNGAPTYQQRLANLDKVIAMTERHEDRIIAAIDQDFGHRSSFESMAADSIGVINGAKYAKKNLKAWMRTRKVKTPLAMKPGRAVITPEPLGVVGIIGPWNYPYLLTIHPLIAALAAGNRAMIKPSEITSHTSELTAELIGETFSEDEVTVVLGGSDIGAEFSALPFDHLFFTGSPAVGRHVAIAAAKNLTPVTLELGGKSPCIIDKDGGLSASLAGMIFGKCFNAGQTCIAPDYAFVPTEQVDAFVERACAIAGKLYPSVAENADLTTIVNEHHFQRLQAMLDDARAKGAMVVEVNPGQEQGLAEKRKQPLTLILNVSEDMRVMQEEIFGPLLPVKAYDSLDEVVGYINDRPKPLALYWFGTNEANRDRILSSTSAGGVTVNDTLWQFSHSNLPFGGVGESGMGTYHGPDGFRTFSHDKPIFYRPAKNSSGKIHPPYTSKTDRLLKLMRKFG